MNRRGVALLIALQAILLLTGLATMALLTARTRSLASGRRLTSLMVRAAASGEAANRATTLSPTLRDSLPPEVPALLGGLIVPGGGVQTTDSVVRLSADLL